MDRFISNTRHVVREQTKFDDDSPMHARLERWAAGSEALSQSFMLRRRKLFDVEKGFDDEKRKVAEAVELALRMWSRCVSVRARVCDCDVCACHNLISSPAFSRLLPQ